MNTETAASAPKPKNFGRTYNYDNGTVGVAVMGKPDAALVLDFTKLPPEVQRGFGMLAYANHCIQSGNDTIREGGTIEDGATAIAAAQSDAEAGKVEFRDGMGLGMSSAPAAALVGRALVEAGLSFFSFKGVRYEFAGDVAKAQAALRTLYSDTTPEVTKNAKGEDVEGDTGRQRFGRIAKDSRVIVLVNSYKKAKPAQDVGLG